MSNIITACKRKLLAGEPLTRGEALALLRTPEPDVLFEAADELRAHFCGNRFDLCTIVNGKSGRCTEDCRYCAQSCHYPAGVESYPLLDGDRLLEGAAYNARKGVLRYSVVTSGRRLSSGETAALCESYRRMRDAGGIALCASHGLLSFEQLCALKAAGVTRYHNNLETSRRFFPSICTTHTYDDKLRTIRDAQRAGLTVCSGGILGLGETEEDRVDLALELRELGIRSVPLNVLNPIPGTPLAGRPLLSEEEVCRAAAVFRFLLPKAEIRLAGGRGLLPDRGRRVFRAGANAAITGDMLTTAGVGIDEDTAMARELGFEVSAE